MLTPITRPLLQFLRNHTGTIFAASFVNTATESKANPSFKGRIKEGDLAAYTYMEKAPQEPDTRDTGGWRFAKFDAKGVKVQIDPVKNCFQCHKPHPESDFVLSEPLK